MNSYEAIRQGTIGQRIRFLLGDSVVYGAADVSTRMLNVFVLPILVRVFRVDEFAIVDGLNVTKVLVLAFVLMGLNQAAARIISQYDDESKKKEVVGQALMIGVPFVGVICVGLILMAPSLVRFLFQSYNSDYVTATRLMLASVPFSVALAYCLMLLKWNFEKTKFVAISVGHVAGVILLSLYLVVQLDMGVPGVFYAQLIVEIVVLLAAVYFCAKYIAVPSGYNYVRQMLAFGSPLMLVGLLQSLVPWGERLLLVRLIGLEAMGLYAVGQRFSRLINIPSSGFNVAWGPFAYAIYKEPDAEATFNKVLRIYSIAIALAGLVLVFAAGRALPLFASDKYLGSLEVVVPLTFAFVIESIGGITGLGIALSNRTYFSTIAYAVSASVTLLTATLWAGEFGIVGVAYAFLLGKLVLTLFQTVLAYFIYPIKFRLATPATSLVVVFGLALIVDRFLWS